MTTFLDPLLLERLPSISLDPMDALMQQPAPGTKQPEPSHAEAIAPQAQDLLLDTKHACTVTTGPQPYCEKLAAYSEKLAAFDEKHVPDYLPKPTSNSPNCTLYPLTSIESSYNGGAQSADSMDQQVPLGLTAARNSIGSCESDVAEEYGLRRSPRTSGSRKGKAPKEKRKVGRPIAYCGDPDSPDLTPTERRRIKRRIANRESARRVRSRRQEQIREMAVRAQEMEKHNMQLASHANSVELQQSQMSSQLGEFSHRLQATVAENEALLREIAQLRACIVNKNGKEEDGADVASASESSLPINHSTRGSCISSNPSGLDCYATGMSFENGMQSAFAASAGCPPLPDAGRANLGSACGAGMLQLPDVPLAMGRLSSRGSSGLLAFGLGNAGSIDQLLPAMDPLDMSLNNFLLGEAC